MPRKAATETMDIQEDVLLDADPAFPEKPRPSNGIPMRKSLIPELYRFVRSIPADAPYEQLGAMAQSAGWIWRLVESDAHSSSPGVYLVRFNVMIGKATNDLDLEYFDTISMSVPIEAPSPSLIARLNAQVALTYMVFNRLPPVPQSMPAPQPVAEPAPVAAAPEPVEEVEWKKPVKAAPPPKEAVSIVKRRTPDGIPIMGDPYEMNGTPDEIVASILETFADGAEEANDKTILNTLWSKNDSAVEFVKDFGSAEDKAQLRNIFKVRAEQIG